MKFDIYEYSRASLLEVGSLGNVLNTIALCLPSDISDVNEVDWLDTPIGVGGFAFNEAAKALRGISINSMKDIDGFGDAAARASTAAGLGVAGTAMNTSQTLANLLGVGGAFNAGQAILGFSLNQFVVLLFVGRSIRDSSFRGQ